MYIQSNSEFSNSTEPASSLVLLDRKLERAIHVSREPVAHGEFPTPYLLHETLLHEDAHFERCSARVGCDRNSNRPGLAT
jgi:hypothetical protein